MSQFNQKVYELLMKVPAGRITTYKVIAETLGTKAYRAVGNALKNNPDAPRIPCHRVIKSSGNIGGFNGETNGKEIQQKIYLLKKEGIKIEEGQIQNLPDVLFYFS